MMVSSYTMWLRLHQQCLPLLATRAFQVLISLLLVETGSAESTIWHCGICQLAGYSQPLKLNAVTNHIIHPRAMSALLVLDHFAVFLCFGTDCSIYDLL